MYIYSEMYQVVVYIPSDAKANNNYDRLQIWYIPGCAYEQEEI